MNTFTIIILTILGIIALLFIIGLFSKKSYSIRREIIIDKPLQVVFDYIKLLKNQDNYSKWVMRDPDMKKDFKGIDGTVGFVYGWDSISNKNAGKGEQEIIKISEGERIDIQIRFEKPFKNISNTYMTTEISGNNQTKVSWVFESSMKYPMNILMLFVNFDKLLGNETLESLHTLKNNLEK